MAYQKTTWIDHVTPITAERLNNMEGGIENALTKDDKAEMVDLVLAALPMWAGGDY